MSKLSELMGLTPIKMRQWLVEHKIPLQIGYSEEDFKNTLINKRNVQNAKLIPFDKKQPKNLGKLNGTVRYLGNIIDPIDEVWNQSL